MITISKILTVIFNPLLWVNSPSSTSQPLSDWTQSTTQSNFRLTPNWLYHQRIYFIQGYCNFPGRSLYYHPSTLWKSRINIHSPANSTPLQLSTKEYWPKYAYIYLVSLYLLVSRYGCFHELISVFMPLYPYLLLCISDWWMVVIRFCDDKLVCPYFGFHISFVFCNLDVTCKTSLLFKAAHWLLEVKWYRFFSLVLEQIFVYVFHF